MSDRDRLLDEIGALEIQLLAGGLPQQTASLLDYDLTIQQLRAFAFVLAQREVSMTRMADALDIKPNVATGIVQRLVDRHLIQRHEDPGDRRVRLLTVTEQGLALLDELAAILLSTARERLSRLSDEQLQQFRDLLGAMSAPAGE